MADPVLLCIAVQRPPSCIATHGRYDVDHIAWSPLTERHVQSIEHDPGPEINAHRPADDPAGERIQDDSEIDEASPGVDVAADTGDTRLRPTWTPSSARSAWMRGAP